MFRSNIDPLRTIPALLAFCLLVACSPPLEIVGEGEILSASGTPNCYLEDFRARISGHPPIVRSEVPLRGNGTHCSRGQIDGCPVLLFC